MTTTEKVLEKAATAGHSDGAEAARYDRDNKCYKPGTTSDWDSALINMIGLVRTREAFGLKGTASPANDPVLAEALSAYNAAAIEAYDAPVE